MEALGLGTERPLLRAVDNLLNRWALHHLVHHGGEGIQIEDGANLLLDLQLLLRPHLGSEHYLLCVGRRLRPAELLPLFAAGKKII